MTRDRIYEALHEIFHNVFDDETIVLKDETTASDIEDWDSLAQINIVVACERKFGLKFDLNDIANLKNVGDMVRLVESKL